MNVLIVSQCHKNALKETRRILDQFAERRGERTWQTAITKAGLETLRKLLRQKARKNTAVACHWIRGHDHSELLWIVGDASQFNARGATPTNTTRRNILRKEDENDWHSLRLIHLLASMAALLHDLGKASDAFQKRLTGHLEGRNRYRHEWVSLRLLEAFVGDDSDDGWLTRLQSPTAEDDERWLKRLRCDGLNCPPTGESPFAHLPPLAAAIGWLIVSHHRLPALPAENDDGTQKRVGAPATLNTDTLPTLPQAITAGWNEIVQPASHREDTPYWTFSGGLPVTEKPWRTRAARLARQLSEYRWATPPLDSPYVMHLARLALMLADHHYSSLVDTGRLTGSWDGPLYANTTSHHGRRELCQPLAEHLLGVVQATGDIVHHLPDMASALPRISRHKGFRARSRNARFRWQDKAFDLATGLRDKSHEYGFFGINMASTGCGKTIANGRILYGLADPDTGARFSIALGLRTLTLQTGQAYRERLGLGSDELAIRVGGSASRALFEHQQNNCGSESRTELLDDQAHVVFEGDADAHRVLGKAVADPQARALLEAPVLVCTIDHLMPATESLRGGRQIAPMLRLMNGDLVLDEPDDFDIDDLPALTRLVYWTGMLGSRVLLSSATLPPALVRGLFDAYQEGRAEYQRHRGMPGAPVAPICAWFDESGCTHQDCADGEAFDAAHDSFARKRAARLAALEPRRRGYPVPVSASSKHPDAVGEAMAQTFLAQAQALHDQHHSLDPHSSKRVSFGLIRMANIEPLVAVAQAIYRAEVPEGIRIHLCVYHSQFPLLLRSRLENRLDRALDRRNPDAVFELADIRARLDDTGHDDAGDHLFIVLGSPVTEVGRDHDYDWAVVEPSSMRSIIQLAGRVRRHRHEPVVAPNMALLEFNLRHLSGKRPAFCRPGFETEQYWSLTKHGLTSLLREHEIESIDSRPRLLPADDLEPTGKLVDLEHARLKALMVEGAEPPGRRRSRRRTPVPRLGAYLFYRPVAISLSAVAIQHWPFRKDNEPDAEFVLLPDEAGEDYGFYRVDEKDREETLTPVASEFDRPADEALVNPRVTPWNEPDYMAALGEQAEAMDMTLERCAKRFGRIRLKPERAPNGWHFHPALGFVRQK